MNILTLFFIKLPIINKIIDKIKVEVISKFKECKIPPTLYILTCTYKNILDNKFLAEIFIGLSFLRIENYSSFGVFLYCIFEKKYVQEENRVF